MKIIAFSGKKQSGKDTVVNFLQKKIKGVALLAFADYLKEIVCVCLGTTQDIVNGSDEDKSKILACGKTVREALQIVGTDWFRSIEPDCWINAYKEELAEIKDGFDDISEGSFDDGLILTPDVRFPNEVKCIQDLGGHVIRLLRAPFPDDKHESETALNWIEKCQLDHIVAGYENSLSVFSDSNLWFDAIIDNRKMTIAEQNEAVWKLVKERNWI